MKKTTKKTTATISINGHMIYQGEIEITMLDVVQTPPVEITPIRIVQDIMSLVGYSATRAQIKAWSDKTREAVVDHCSAVHLKASDNIVKLPKKPGVLNGLEKKYRHTKTL